MRLFELFIIIIVSLVSLTVLSIQYYTCKEKHEEENKQIVMVDRLSIEGRGSVRITNRLSYDRSAYRHKRSYILSQRLP